MGDRVDTTPRGSEGVTSQYYKDYYGRVGTDRNDLRTNPGVLFQVLASESALVHAMREYPFPIPSSTLLDVGCGSAGDLYHILRLGFRQEQITGIDIIEERLNEAKASYPRAKWIHGDASATGIPDASFDLEFEMGMFATLTDDGLSTRIAGEMLRVCKPGGYLLLLDWRTPKPNDPAYKALTRRRLRSLFKVGDATELVSIHPGALLPPVGRFLSAHLPSLYFLAGALLPFLVGQVAYLLVKKRNKHSGS